MATSLGDFLRAKRDSIRPEQIGLPVPTRTRAAGLRRSDVAARSGISVEYLTRIEQGRDRNPSPGVLNALADGLSLDAAEREHLRYLAKISGGVPVALGARAGSSRRATWRAGPATPAGAGRRAGDQPDR